MEKEIPDAGLVVLKEAGHFSYLDKFSTILPNRREFLEESQTLNVGDKYNT